nr:hypothetical protein [Tanacetum cinerariifolium]
MINIYDGLYEDYLEVFATNHQSGNPTFSSHSDLASPKVKDDIFNPKGDIVLIEKLLNLDSTKDLPPPHNINPLSGSTTSSSLDHLLEEFVVTPDKNEKKISISNASLILEDFNPPLYELPFHKEVHGSETLLSFSSEIEEKVFKLEILTSKGVHTSLLLELSHPGPKTFKVITVCESPMKIFPCSYGEDIRILDVPCLHIYLPWTTQFGDRVKLSDLKQALRGWQPMLILIYL